MSAQATQINPRFHRITHPVVRHKLSMLRDKDTTSHSFRLILEEISQYLAYEATRDLKVAPQPVETPLEKAQFDRVAEEVVLVSVMRAGNGMLDGMLRILPFATVGHIGIYRDKFLHSTVEYYLRMPKNVKGKRVIMLDPMLATGDTALAAIKRLKEFEVGQIRLITILCSEYALKRLREEHPDVEIYSIDVERELDARGYLLPGLGDAGDRLYDTV
jgi:uracil phosphoribosyltransferase